jgi:hypothetical protein
MPGTKKRSNPDIGTSLEGDKHSHMLQRTRQTFVQKYAALVRHRVRGPWGPSAIYKSERR